MTKYEVVGPDADLDSEVVLLPNGERLTNQAADEIADDLLGRRGLYGCLQNDGDVHRRNESTGKAS